MSEQNLYKIIYVIFVLLFFGCVSKKVSTTQSAKNHDFNSTTYLELNCSELETYIISDWVYEKSYTYHQKDMIIESVGDTLFFSLKEGDSGDRIVGSRVFKLLDADTVGYIYILYGMRKHLSFDNFLDKEDTVIDSKSFCSKIEYMTIFPSDSGKYQIRVLDERENFIFELYPTNQSVGSEYEKQLSTYTPFVDLNKLGKGNFIIEIRGLPLGGQVREKLVIL